jgi:hypothetical protein
MKIIDDNPISDPKSDSITEDVIKNAPAFSAATKYTSCIALLLILTLVFLPVILGLNSKEGDPYVWAALVVAVLTYPFFLLLRRLGLKPFQLSQDQIIWRSKLRERSATEHDSAHDDSVLARAHDLAAKQKKFVNALEGLGICLFMRVVLLFTDRFNLPPNLERDIQSTATWVSLGLLFTLLVALVRQASLARVLYPRRKALLMTFFSLLTVTFPLVAYIVYRDSKCMCVDQRTENN